MLKFGSKGNSLVVQWLGPCAFTAGGVGSIPGWGTKILQAAGHGQNKKQKKFGSRQRRALFLRPLWDPVFFSCVLHVARFPWPRMELQPVIDLSKQRDRHRGKGQRRKRVLGARIKSQVPRSCQVPDTQPLRISRKTRKCSFVLDCHIR